MLPGNAEAGSGIAARPLALTTKDEIMIIRVQSEEQCLSHNFFAKVFTTLENRRLSVDLMTTNAAQVSMAVISQAPHILGDTGNVDEITNHDLHGAIQDLSRFGRVEVVPHMAIVSIIGRQVGRMPELAGDVFSALGRNKIQSAMICQGASDLSISCVVAQSCVSTAVSVLHDDLFARSASH
ncbi:hypothetical protein F5Y16DRAFT_299935 [Xylariaceae sp. FL0255]|nr:hypothetical protein F5Y16DRAFT_299935 [Xylariaceae sp. FL0255]